MSCIKEVVCRFFLASRKPAVYSGPSSGFSSRGATFKKYSIGYKWQPGAKREMGGRVPLPPPAGDGPEFTIVALWRSRDFFTIFLKLPESVPACSISARTEMKKYVSLCVRVMMFQTFASSKFSCLVRMYCGKYLLLRFLSTSLCVAVVRNFRFLLSHCKRSSGLENWIVYLLFNYQK